jgi:hypothetical protein
MRGARPLFWGVLVGGGAFALASLGRKAEASTRPTSQGPQPALLAGLGSLARPEPTPANVDPGSGRATVAPAGPVPPPSASAPLAPWNRRTDDGGPPLFIGDDVEAMARVITSEAGSGPLAERVALGWLVRNRARARRPLVSVARLVCSPCGESSGNARPFSTRLPATSQNRELAALILASPQSEDPTQGGTNCFEPGLQDRLHAAGRKGHRLDAKGVRYCWLRSLDFYGSVGRWDLFGPKGGRGARPVPRTWGLEGYSVCCYGDTRPACRGKQPGDRVEVST